MSEVQTISALEWLRLLPRGYCFQCQLVYLIHRMGCGQHIPEKEKS